MSVLRAGLRVLVLCWPPCALLPRVLSQINFRLSGGVCVLCVSVCVRASVRVVCARVCVCVRARAFAFVWVLVFVAMFVLVLAFVCLCPRG